MDAKKQTPIVLIAICLVAAAASIGVFYYSTQPSQTDIEASTTAVDAGTDTQSELSVEDATTPPTPETEAEVQPEQAVVSEPVEDQREALTESKVTQGINLARVRPDGTAVIAGVAPPGSTVTLRIGDRVIGSAVATANGEWVVVPDDLLEPGSHLITVTITKPDGSSTVDAMALVIEMPASGDETPLVALVPYAVEEAPVVVLQAPDTPEVDTSSSETATAMPRVTIRSVQALNPGYISVGGRAEGGASVQLSVNGIVAKADPVKKTGLYQMGQSLDPDAGKAMLVVTLMDDAGSALASARLNLSRGQIDTTLSSNTLVVVQKGDALWRIAYQTYGKGIRYVDIYRENSSIIRDPDLIYPDQIFVVPNS